MIDGSHSMFEENIAVTKAVADACRPSGHSPLDALRNRFLGKAAGSVKHQRDRHHLADLGQTIQIQLRLSLVHAVGRANSYRQGTDTRTLRELFRLLGSDRNYIGAAELLRIQYGG